MDLLIEIFRGENLGLVSGLTSQPAEKTNGQEGTETFVCRSVTETFNVFVVYLFLKMKSFSLKGFREKEFLGVKSS